jgi:hypothetical protein
MRTRKLPGVKGRSALKANNLTAIYEPIVCNMWEPRRLTNLWACYLLYVDTFSYPTFVMKMLKLPRQNTGVGIQIGGNSTDMSATVQRRLEETGTFTLAVADARSRMKC